MKSLAKFVTLFCVAATFSFSASADQKLTGADIRSIVHGSYAIVIYGFEIDFEVSKNGSLKATFLGDSDTGKWSLKGDKLCISFDNWTDGETSCSALEYDGEKWFTSEDGTEFFSR